MRTVTRKFAKRYLTRKLNDNLKVYESEQKASKLVHLSNSTAQHR